MNASSTQRAFCGPQQLILLSCCKSPGVKTKETLLPESHQNEGIESCFSPEVSVARSESHS